MHFFYTFTPLMVVSRVMTGKSWSRAPSYASGASCFDFRIHTHKHIHTHRNWTIIFPILFRHGLDSSAFFYYFYLLNLSKHTRITSRLRPHGDVAAAAAVNCIRRRCTAHDRAPAVNLLSRRNIAYACTILYYIS